MAQEPETSDLASGVEVIDQQPSSPSGSASSREGTRDARERLKKTSIAGLRPGNTVTGTTLHIEPLSETDASTTIPAADHSNGTRGRPAKKRSFEDLAKDEVDAALVDGVPEPPLPKSGHHKRMRSRDFNSGEHTQAYTKLDADKHDTLHEETDINAQKSPGGPGILVDAPSQEEMDADSAANSTRHNDQSDTKTDSNSASATTGATTTKVPSTSGFANASAASPFGQVKSPSQEKSPDPAQPTSSSAFKSSGISAFAASDKSPFGAGAGSKSAIGGGFGGPSSNNSFGPAKSGFGSTSAFSTSATSAFGGSSSGFGSAKPFGGTSFGAPKPFGGPSVFGSGGTSFAAAKPIGLSARQEEDEEAENGEDEEASSIAKDDAQQDPRFREQQVETGEQDEEISFSSRARLYFFEGAWKERGTGLFKINIRTTKDSSSETETETDLEAQGSTNKQKARLLMRADATHRVILNTPVFKGMRFGAPDNSEPTGKIMHLQSLEDGKPVPLQIKIGKEEVLKELYHRLRELEAEA